LAMALFLLMCHMPNHNAAKAYGTIQTMSMFCVVVK